MDTIQIEGTRDGGRVGVKIDKEGVVVTQKYTVDGHEITRSDSMSKKAFEHIYKSQLR